MTITDMHEALYHGRASLEPNKARAVVTTRAHLVRIVRTCARRIVELERVREAALEGFEATDSASYCVRRMDVVNHVAGSLGILADIRLVRSVKAVALGLGWRPVVSRNKRLFSGVRLKGIAPDEALRRSRELRGKA